MPPEIFSTSKQESPKLDQVLNMSLHKLLHSNTRKKKNN